MSEEENLLLGILFCPGDTELCKIKLRTHNLCPGVTIGDNSVIGAGSVVIKDILQNSFAAGNPCKVIRTITSNDSMKNRPEILGENRIIPY